MEHLEAMNIHKQSSQMRDDTATGGLVSSDRLLSRRRALAQLAGSAAWFAESASLAALGAPSARPLAPSSPFTPVEEAFLDELERACVLYFWEAGDRLTGLVKDRSRADGPDRREVASVAATGFGLTALCIAADRGYLAHADAQQRAATTLRYLFEQMPHVHGFYYHFVNTRTGGRVWRCELSSIDTALLLCGVLTCRQYFQDEDIRRLARQIYERVDWSWMLAGGETLCHGWKPESGFLQSRWDEYCEHMLLYLLAIGSPTHPIPAGSWHAWQRPWFQYDGLRYINPRAPLFIHQYSHAWFDFQGRRDRYADYFENSVTATRAHRAFCLKLRARFPQFGENLWGITASDSARGYVAWGGPPELDNLDGTLVPCAAAGSLPFLPGGCLHVLQTMRARFGDRVWKRYGFVDAFNPHTDWVDPDVIGIDVGITLLMAENARSRRVWNMFMKNEEARRAMELVGLRTT
jgi:hypothetical protein